MGKTFYECNCPDFTRKQTLLVNTDYPSQQISRDWTGTEAGVQGKNKWCKHIYAVLITRGELAQNGGIPTDIPIAKNNQDKDHSHNQERYQQGYGGTDFTGNWGVRAARGIKG